MNLVGNACVSTSERLDLLRREVQVLTQMDHRGIVRMVDCYKDANSVHIVTERCTGGELFDGEAGRS